MMIEGKYNGIVRLSGLPQPNGGSSAITADLKERSNRCGLARPFAELLAFIIREKPAHFVARGLGRDLGYGMGHDALRVIS